MPRQRVGHGDELGSPAVERMLAGVANGLGIWRGSLWYEDALQEARILIWQSGAAPGAWPTVARRAMVDELRRELGRRGDRPLMVSLDELSGLACVRPGPEACAHATAVLARLERARPGWAQAIILSPSLLAAGRHMGVSQAMASIVCSALAREALRLADRQPRPQAYAPPCSKPTRTAAHVALQARQSAARAAECRQLQQAPGVADVDRPRLAALARAGGDYARAAAALGMRADGLRRALMRARRGAQSRKL